MIFELNCNGCEHANRERNNSEEGAKQNVNHALDANLPQRHGKGKQFLQFKAINQVRLELAINHTIKFGHQVNVNRLVAHPHEHTHNFLRRRTFVRNDNTRYLVLLNQRSKICILAKHRNIRKFMFHDLEAFIDKAHHSLSAFGSLR